MQGVQWSVLPQINPLSGFGSDPRHAHTHPSALLISPAVSLSPPLPSLSFHPPPYPFPSSASLFLVLSLCVIARSLALPQWPSSSMCLICG